MTTIERDPYAGARDNAAGWLTSIEEMVAALQAAHNADEEVGDKVEECERTIHESVLSVCVRSDWHSPGEIGEPDEYHILLSTGGPALRIWGKLGDHGEAISAELQMQDWGTPWGRYPAPEAVLLDFAQNFYFVC